MTNLIETCIGKAGVCKFEVVWRKLELPPTWMMRMREHLSFQVREAIASTATMYAEAPASASTPQNQNIKLETMKKYFYHRHLPHFLPEESVFFITYRLAGSIPLSVIAQMNEEYEVKKERISILPMGPEERKLQLVKLQHTYFSIFDGILDKKLNEPYWLENDSIAAIVAELLHFLAKDSIEL